MSRLVVATPATTRQVLTIAAMRRAAGLASGDASQDEALSLRGLAVADAICDDCNIRVGEGAEPTLLRESLVETFDRGSASRLRLARRHSVVISSVTVDGETVAGGEYAVDAEAGLLTFSGVRRFGYLVVAYDAGFSAPPPLLQQEALDRFAALVLADERDPYIKGTSVETVGVETVRTDYWAGQLPGTGNAAASISSALKRFYNPVVA